MVVGVSSAQGKFFGSFAVLSSHEDTEAWKEIYSFVHRQDIHPRYRMADGAQSITKAGEEVFSDCEDCRDSERLMCWSHVHRAITPQLKSLRLLNKEVASNLLSDIEEIQWSANNSTFSSLNLLEEKYSSNVSVQSTFQPTLLWSSPTFSWRSLPSVRSRPTTTLSLRLTRSLWRPMRVWRNYNWQAILWTNPLMIDWVKLRQSRFSSRREIRKTGRIYRYDKLSRSSLKFQSIFVRWNIYLFLLLYRPYLS